MKIAQPKHTDELRMSGDEFDKMMRKALQVHPEVAQKPKKAAKAKSKAVRKKTK